MWAAHDPASTRAVDHGPRANFLKKYRTRRPDGVAAVVSGTVTDTDKAALKVYVEGLAAVAVGRLNRPEQLAYWINLYNALTVRVMLDH
ncbi:MAG: DUF547 domain-containing protein [Rhodospirillaceae bacterium]